MKLTIHRGTHEIGGTCIEVSSKDSRIILDIGIPIVAQDGSKFDFKKYEKLTGPELVSEKILPNVSGLYSWDTKNKPPDGLLISHSHGDHYGLVKYVRKDLRCYLSEGTKRIIELGHLFFKTASDIETYSILKPGETTIIGSFSVTPYLMDHSAFDALSFLIESNGKRIFYSGDFRAHGRKERAFEYLLKKGPENIDALLMEGSLVGSGYDTDQKTESELETEIVAEIEQSKGIVFCMPSAHNIDRLVTLYLAAFNTKRTFIVDIYTAHVLDALKDLGKIPHAGGYPNIRVFYPQRLTKKIADENDKSLLYKFKPHQIKKAEISEAPSKYIMLIRNTMISDLRGISNINSGTVIYSIWKGYLSDGTMDRLLKFIDEKHLKLVTIHTSGHASLSTLQKMVAKLKPKKVIPIHTFNPDKYKNLFPNVLEISDGVEFNI
jgi:ribonuclease J